MVSVKPLLSFFGRFLLVLILVMAPWPGLRKAYATFFRSGGNLVSLSLGLQDSVRFVERPQQHHHQRETHVEIEDRRSRMTLRVEFSSREFGYLPTVFVLALTLAAPITWSRKRRSLLWLLVLVNAYVVLRVGIVLLYFVCMDPALAIFQLDLVWRMLLAFAYTLAISYAGSFLVPLPMWFLLCFRTSDWPRLSEPGRAGC